ncbi:hypothetical protein [Thermophagus xiamenensis]|uniref:Uncharacterized protein n=1 Tax=Thermophagus xiamenensis TaxID=385682 RepID=A0A1I1VIV7_9BACT|nr:hypothetical protein [Thermophagus xiamenensis]SFD81003.1 hypothetical protein SAMN05444380_102135 [Thermophagus xiamenensis]
MLTFKPKPLIKPNLIQRLLKIEPSENALIEINNRLAQVEKIEEIASEEFINIADHYKVNLKKKFRKERIELFRQLVREVINDNQVSDLEAMQLKHLRDLLLLDQQEAEKVLKEETHRRFGEQIDEALTDNRLSKKEKEKLEQLRKDLLIEEEVAQKMISEKGGALLQKFLENAVSDQRLSPDEEQEMHAIAQSLGIDLEFDAPTQEALARFRLYWQIENGILPELVPDIHLYKNEKLHFQTPVHWIEHKKVTRRVNYGGPTARIKLAKGFYYRVGSLGVNRITEDVWQRIDSGMLYLTDRRIIFMGELGNKNIRLNSVLTFKPYSNGVDIRKATGKSPFLEFSDNVDLFSMILARLLMEN